jgi:acetylornithine deacetylase/succinyl-diaminopimelate desuccinylase-like protein
MPDIGALARLPTVREAIRILHETDGETIADQLRLVQLPAPTLEESTRAAHFRVRCIELGLEDPRIDAAGNVLAWLPNSTDRAEPVLVAAHLDTVFPAGTALVPRRVGKRIFTPGIADNARGLAALLALGRAMTRAGVRTERTVVLIATVGEEGNGDLSGVKHLFREGSDWRAAAAFIGVDGTGRRRIVNQAVGSRRLRVVVRGPGGHSWADWGRANPIDAVGQVITELKRRISPLPEKSTLTIGRIAGGTSINTIPAEAWLELDLRSEDHDVLIGLEAKARAVIEAAVRDTDDQRRPGTPALTVQLELIGDRPAGRTPPDTPLVAAARAATEFIGETPELLSSSTDANIPISLGIPAITLGAGGDSGGAHTTEEWYENDGGPAGLERLLLTILAIAGVGSSG